MKLHIICSAIAAITLSASAMAQITESLPAPDRTGGLPLMQTLDRRYSVREFDSARALSRQQISDLLWATAGVNRKQSGKRTNPTARDARDISVYMLDTTGAYLYNPVDNTITKVADGDHRALLAGGQKFVLQAPVSFLFVADLNKFSGSPRALTMAAIDAGIACENLNLYCTSAGLATVPRATMDTDALSSLLGLTDKQIPLLNNPVGYAK